MLTVSLTVSSHKLLVQWLCILTCVGVCRWKKYCSQRQIDPGVVQPFYRTSNIEDNRAAALAAIPSAKQCKTSFDVEVKAVEHLLKAGTLGCLPPVQLDSSGNVIKDLAIAADWTDQMGISPSSCSLSPPELLGRGARGRSLGRGA